MQVPGVADSNPQEIATSSRNLEASSSRDIMGANRGRGISRVRGSGRGHSRGAKNGPLCGIGNWNGVGMSTGSTFIHHSQMVKISLLSHLCSKPYSL